MNQRTFLTLLYIFSSIISMARGLQKDKVVIAINCGGDSYTDKDEVEYIADKYYNGGVKSDHGLNYDIAGTSDMELYQTERWSSETLTYSLPVSSPGKYVLILKFSEVYFQRNNEKVFDIAIGKKVIVKDLDIFSKVGKGVAHDEFIEFEIKNDKVLIDNKEANGGYDAKKKEIKLRFLKGSKDNPKINAIVVLKGNLNQSEFVEKKKKNDRINQKKLQEGLKKQRLDLRHHSDEDFNEEALLNDESILLINEDKGILSVFFTKEGITIWISIGVFFGLNYLLDFIH